MSQKMHRKGNKWYDDDDLDYEEDDYYDDYDEPGPAPKPQPKPAAASKPASAMAAAVKPPAKKGGKGAQQAPPQTFPAAPQGSAFDFAMPSPDDEARRARRRPGEAPGTSAAAAPAPAAPATGPVPAYRPPASFVPDPTVLAQCRSLADAEAEGAGGKGRLHLAVLGHVDAGKSTLVGRVLHEAGEVSAQQVARAAREAERLGKGSFAWAFLLDERSDERERGVTADVGTAVFQTPRRVVTVLDSPGHRDFVPKMIVGAGMADAAVLVIDGALGGFEAGFKEPDSGPGANPAAVGGQTREHAHLARNLGIVALVVAITKLDTVPGGAAAAQARFAAIREDLGVFLESVGFEPARVSWVPVVPTLGENVAAAPSPKGALAWWGGPTLLGAVDALPVRERPVVAPARVTVAEVDKKRGLGVYVGGRVEAGALRVGSRVVVMPGGETHVVKGLEVHGRTVEIARAGDAAAVGLGDADAVTLRRGCVVCEAGFPVHVARRVACEVAVIDTAIPIIPGFQGVLHMHTDSAECTVEKLVCLKNTHTGEVIRERPRVLNQGQCAVVHLHVPSGICCEAFADIPALGRLAVRDAGRTVFAGVVVEVLE